MRVLHVSDTRAPVGGGEAYVERLMSMLDEGGHAVRWWAPSDAPPTNLGEIHSVWNRGPGKRLAEEIRSWRPDLIHLHGFLHRLSGAGIALGAELSVPWVHTAHSFGSVCPRLTYLRVGRGVCDQTFPSHACFGSCFRSEPLRNLIRYPRLHLAQKAMGKHLSCILAPSKLLVDVLARRFPHIPCRHVPHPIPLAEPERSRATERNRRSFLYAGRLLPSKGADLAVRALARLPLSCELRVIGGGQGEERLRQLATTLGVAGRVEFLGRRSAPEVLAEMRTCAALLVPTLVPETGPLVVLEAFSVGTLAIASNHGGAAELIREGTDGFLVRPGAVGALANAIKKVAALPEARYQQMLDSASERALEFTPAKHYHRVLAAYGEALRSPTDDPGRPVSFP